MWNMQISTNALQLGLQSAHQRELHQGVFGGGLTDMCCNQRKQISRFFICSKADSRLAKIWGLAECNDFEDFLNICEALCYLSCTVLKLSTKIAEHDWHPTLSCPNAQPI